MYDSLEKLKYIEFLIYRQAICGVFVKTEPKVLVRTFGDLKLGIIKTVELI